jgi:hypothetical protein
MDRLDTPLIFICLLKKTWFFSWGYTSLNQPVCLASLNRKSQIDMDFLMELQSIINHIKTLEIRTKVSLCFYISLSTISPQNMAGYIYIYSHTSLFCSKKHSSRIPPETLRLNSRSQSLQANSSISVTPSIRGGSSILKAPKVRNFRRESSSCKWSKS